LKNTVIYGLVQCGSISIPIPQCSSSGDVTGTKMIFSIVSRPGGLAVVLSAATIEEKM